AADLASPSSSPNAPASAMATTSRGAGEGSALVEDAYPSAELEAAAMLHSLVRNHALVGVLAPPGPSWP
ncbi:MAG TPA: hypothetical protein VGA69_12405, partial [Nitriliruptorales bacterium]